jgi:hypothetical protein
VRSGQGAQVSATGGNDGIDVIGLEDVAHGDGRHVEFVADLVRERHLEHAPVDRCLLLADLPRRDMDDVGARVT